LKFCPTKPLLNLLVLFILILLNLTVVDVSNPLSYKAMFFWLVFVKKSESLYLILVISTVKNSGKPALLSKISFLPTLLAIPFIEWTFFTSSAIISFSDITGSFKRFLVIATKSATGIYL